MISSPLLSMADTSIFEFVQLLIQHLLFVLKARICFFRMNDFLLIILYYVYMFLFCKKQKLISTMLTIIISFILVQLTDGGRSF